MKNLKHILILAGAIISPVLFGNIMVNPGLNTGDGNLQGYEAFAVWSKGTTNFSSAWGLADAPVVADGSGSATFGMNTQLANADAFWAGATQEMTFQQNFWTPDNNAGTTPTTDLYGQTITFTGEVTVSEAFADGNTSQAFIQFLDQSYNATWFEPIDITEWAGGAFSIEVDIPESGLNIIQVGFRNSGIEGTAGEITFSNLSVTAAPTVVDDTTWAGYDIDSSGNVDTGDFLGLIYVANGDWVYSYDFENWLYFPESHVSLTGGWGYSSAP